MQVVFDTKQAQEFARLMKEHPRLLLKNLARAYNEMGQLGITSFRSQQLAGGGGLNVKQKGLAKTFKYKATDPARAKDFRQLFMSAYTKWEAAGIHQTGGTISGKGGKHLLILTDAGRGKTGRRRFTREQLRQKIEQKIFKIIPTPRGAMVIDDSRTKLTKTGKFRKGARVDIIAWLRKRVTIRKRLRFIEHFDGLQKRFEGIYGSAVEKTLGELAKQK